MRNLPHDYRVALMPMLGLTQNIELMLDNAAGVNIPENQTINSSYLSTVSKKSRENIVAAYHYLAGQDQEELEGFRQLTLPNKAVKAKEMLDKQSQERMELLEQRKVDSIPPGSHVPFWQRLRPFSYCWPAPAIEEFEPIIDGDEPISDGDSDYKVKVK